MAEIQSAPNETTRLTTSSSKPKATTAKKQSLNCSCALRRVCVSSKSVILIFAWTFIVGFTYEGASIAATILKSNYQHIINEVGSYFYPVIAVYFLLAMTTVFYPLSGFLADVCCGRYRIVVASLWILWLCLFLVTIMVTIIFSTDLPLLFHYAKNPSSIDLLACLTYGLFITASAGYTSNIVQLGFDQLLDQPSQYLGMFVHWYVWSENLGIAVAYLLYVLRKCSMGNHQVGMLIAYIIFFSPSLVLLLLSFLLVFSLFARRYFYAELAQYNPYKMILSVLNFARKNKRPCRPPSAFVYTYHRKPSRLDFAKDVYGGRFKSSDVNDVKTFGRVLLVLLALGPIFILQVSTSYIVFPIFALHSGEETIFHNDTCSWRWLLLESGSFSFLITVFALPIYIWLVYSVLRNRVPKILVRLGLAVVLYILAVVSMLVVDLSGHIILHGEGARNTTCMFLQPIFGNAPFDPLYLSWWVLLLPNILMNLAPKLILATTLEFISAQSPHSMKGVLVGLLFAIKGFYQLIGASLMFPFSLKIWRQLSSVVSCEFGYFLVTILISLIGLVCFTVAVCKYKYRVRDEEEFTQNDVEEVFDRRLRQEEEYRQSRQRLLAHRDGSMNSMDDVSSSY